MLRQEIKRQAIVKMAGNKARMYSGYFSIDAESHKNFMHCLNNEYPFQSCTIDKYGNGDVIYEGEDFTVGEAGDFPKFGFICDNNPDISNMTESKKMFQP